MLLAPASVKTYAYNTSGVNTRAHHDMKCGTYAGVIHVDADAGHDNRRPLSIPPGLALHSTKKEYPQSAHMSQNMPTPRNTESVRNGVSARRPHRQQTTGGPVAVAIGREGWDSRVVSHISLPLLCCCATPDCERHSVAAVGSAEEVTW